MYDRLYTAVSFVLTQVKIDLAILFSSLVRFIWDEMEAWKMDSFFLSFFFPVAAAVDINL